MPLFGKKEVCALCGGKLPLMGTVKIADGKICPQCREQCTQYISIPQMFTANDMRQNMADAQENKRLYEIFNPQELPYGLQVDFGNRLLAIATKKYLRLQKAYIFRFDEIQDYDVNQDGKTIQKSGAGGAVVGGILFGGLGAVAGGLMGHKQKETITKLSITLKTSNRWAPTIEIPIIAAEIKKDSASYAFAKSSTEKILQALDVITRT